MWACYYGPVCLFVCNVSRRGISIGISSCMRYAIWSQSGSCKRGGIAYYDLTALFCSVAQLAHVVV
jgi:hypothetical protein